MRSIVIHNAGLRFPDKPVGCYFLAGPTGTGKTYFVETIANVLHGSSKNLLRIDCGSYTLEHEVARLVGAPPGYLGHKETKPLLNTAALASITSQHSGISVVLFDEIDKAAPALHNLLLGVMDKGSLKTGDGSVVSFERALVFFTSNHGQADTMKLLKGKTVGLLKEDNFAVNTSVIRKSIERALPAEFINRMDGWLYFSPLSRRSAKKILDLELQAIVDYISGRSAQLSKLNITMTAEAKEWLVDNGYSVEYGARPLRRLLSKVIVEPIAMAVIEGRTVSNVHCEVIDGEFVLDTKRKNKQVATAG